MDRWMEHRLCVLVTSCYLDIIIWVPATLIMVQEGLAPAHLFPYQAEDGTMGAAHFQSIDANTLTPKFPNITIPIYYWFPNVRFPKLFQLFQVASGLHVTSCYGSSCRRKGSLDDVRCSFTKTWEFHMSYSWVDMIQSGNCGFTWMAVFF